MSESAPELLLVNARLVLALVSALACGVTTFSRITPPPCCRLRRLQFVHALPILSGDQDYRTMARPHHSYRPAASLHFVGDCRQILGLADRLLFHTTKYVRHTARYEGGRHPASVWATPISTAHVAKRQHLAAWGWPYSGPRAPGVSGVNAGESLGPCRASCRERQQVRGPVVLAPKGRSGTLTRKRSLVQIQYGPRHFSKTRLVAETWMGASDLPFWRFVAGQSTSHGGLNGRFYPA